MTRKDWYMYLIKITLVTTLVALGRDFGFRGSGEKGSGLSGLWDRVFGARSGMVWFRAGRL